VAVCSVSVTPRILQDTGTRAGPARAGRRLGDTPGVIGRGGQLCRKGTSKPEHGKDNASPCRIFIWANACAATYRQLFATQPGSKKARRDIKTRCDCSHVIAHSKHAALDLAKPSPARRPAWQTNNLTAYIRTCNRRRATRAARPLSDSQRTSAAPSRKSAIDAPWLAGDPAQPRSRWKLLGCWLLSC
jgi:hypothetical protein